MQVSAKSLAWDSTIAGVWWEEGKLVVPSYSRVAGKETTEGWGDQACRGGNVQTGDHSSIWMLWIIWNFLLCLNAYMEYDTSLKSYVWFIPWAVSFPYSIGCILRWQILLSAPEAIVPLWSVKDWHNPTPPALGNHLTHIFYWLQVIAIDFVHTSQKVYPKTMTNWFLIHFFPALFQSSGLFKWARICEHLFTNSVTIS